VHAFAPYHYARAYHDSINISTAVPSENPMKAPKFMAHSEKLKVRLHGAAIAGRLWLKG
jgi:hypothetical protein